MIMSKRKHARINEGESDSNVNFDLAYNKENSQIRVNILLSQSGSNGLRVARNEILPSDLECKCCSPTSCSTNFGLSAKSTVDEIEPETPNYPYTGKDRKGECPCANPLRVAGSPTPTDRGEGSEQSVSLAINVHLKIGSKYDRRECSPHDTEDSWMEQPNQLSYLAETVSKNQPGSPQPLQFTVPYHRVPAANDQPSSKQLTSGEHLGEPENKNTYTPSCPTDQNPSEPVDWDRKASQIVEDAIVNAVNIFETTSITHSQLEQEVASVGKSVTECAVQPMTPSQIGGTQNIPAIQETDSLNLNISTCPPNLQQYTNEECINSVDIENNSENYRQIGRLVSSIIETAKERVHLEGQPEKQVYTEGGCYLQCTLSETRDQLFNSLQASADTDQSHELLVQDNVLPIQRESVEDISGKLENVLFSGELTSAVSGVGESVKQTDEQKLKSILGQPSWEPDVGTISPNNEQQPKLEPSPGHITMVNLQINSSKVHSKESRQTLDEDPSFTSLEVQMGSHDEHMERSSVSSLTEKVKFVFLSMDKAETKSKSISLQEAKPSLVRHPTPIPTYNDTSSPPDIISAENAESPNKPDCLDKDDAFLTLPDGLNAETVFSLSPENLANNHLRTTNSPRDIDDVEVPASVDDELMNELVTDNVDYFPNPDLLLVNEPHGVDVVDETTIEVFGQEKVCNDNEEPSRSTNIGSDPVELAQPETLPIIMFENGGIMDIANLELSVKSDDLEVVDASQPAELGESPRQEQVSQGKPGPLEEGHQAIEDTFDETMHGIASNREWISDSNKVIPDVTNIPQVLSSSKLEQQHNEEVEQPKEAATDGSESLKLSENPHQADIDPSLIDAIPQEDPEPSTRSPLLQEPVSLRSPSPPKVIFEEVEAYRSDVVAQSLEGSPRHSNLVTQAGQTTLTTGSSSSKAKPDVASGSRQSVGLSGIDNIASDKERKRVSVQRGSEKSIQPEDITMAKNGHGTEKITSNMQLISRRDDHMGCTCSDASQVSRINVEICLNMCSSCTCPNSQGLTAKCMKPPPPPPPDSYFFDEFPEETKDPSHMSNGTRRFPNNDHSPKSTNGMSAAVGHGKNAATDIHRTNKNVMEGGKLMQSGSDRADVLTHIKKAAISKQIPVSPVSEASVHYVSNGLSGQTTQPVCLVNSLTFGNLVESDQPKSFVQWGDTQGSTDLQMEPSRGSPLSARVSETRGRMHHEKARQFHVVEIPVLPKYDSTLFGNPTNIPDPKYSKERHRTTPDSELGTKISPTKMSSTCAPVLRQLSPVACPDSVSQPLTEPYVPSNNRASTVQNSAAVNTSDPIDLKIIYKGEAVPSTPSHMSNRRADTKRTDDTKKIRQDLPYSGLQDSALSDTLQSLTRTQERSIARRKDDYASPRKPSSSVKRRRVTRDDGKKMHETDSVSYTSVSAIDNLTSRRVNATFNDADGRYGNFRPREAEFSTSRKSSNDLPVLPSPIGTVDYLRQFRNYSLIVDSTDHDPTVGLFRKRTTQPDDIMTDVGRLSGSSLKYGQTRESQEEMPVFKMSDFGKVLSSRIGQDNNIEGIMNANMDQGNHTCSAKCCGALLKEDEVFSRTSLRDSVKTRRHSHQSSSLPGFHESTIQTSSVGDPHGKRNLVRRKSSRLVKGSLDNLNDISPRTTSNKPSRHSSKISNMPHHQKSTISQLLKQRHSSFHCICCHDNNEDCISWLNPSGGNFICRKRRLSLSSSRYHCHRPQRESLLIQSLNLCSNPTDESRRFDHFFTEMSGRLQPVFSTMLPRVGGGDRKNGPATPPWDNPLTSPSFVRIGERIIDCLPVIRSEEPQQCFCKCHSKTDSAIF